MGGRSSAATAIEEAGVLGEALGGAPEKVETALQDVGGGDAVDDVAAAYILQGCLDFLGSLRRSRGARPRGRWADRARRGGFSRTGAPTGFAAPRSEEHTSELQSRPHLVCRLL